MLSTNILELVCVEDNWKKTAIIILLMSDEIEKVFGTACRVLCDILD